MMGELEKRVKDPNIDKLNLFNDEQRDYIMINDVVDVVELLIARSRSTSTRVIYYYYYFHFFFNF